MIELERFSNLARGMTVGGKGMQGGYNLEQDWLYAARPALDER